MHFHINWCLAFKNWLNKSTLALSKIQIWFFSWGNWFALWGRKINFNIACILLIYFTAWIKTHLIKNICKFLLIIRHYFLVSSLLHTHHFKLFLFIIRGHRVLFATISMSFVSMLIRASFTIFWLMLFWFAWFKTVKVVSLKHLLLLLLKQLPPFLTSLGL